jgi:hypothetical protein
MEFAKLDIPVSEIEKWVEASAALAAGHKWRLDTGPVFVPHLWGCCLEGLRLSQQEVFLMTCTV